MIETRIEDLTFEDSTNHDYKRIDHKRAGCRFCRALDELGKLIKRFIASKNGDQTESLLSKLRRVEIHGPADFAKNLDVYLNSMA